MDAGEVRAREHGVADRRSWPVDEVDDAVRQPGLLEQAHDEVRGVGGGRRRLPDDRVAHQRRRGREVAADGREVERADGEDEALERAVLQPVPDARRRHGLLRVDARQVVGVEAPEVDQLGGGVDLGLVRGLRLVEHRGGVRASCATGRRAARRRGGRRRRAPPTASATTRARRRRRPRSPASTSAPPPSWTSASTCAFRCGMTASNVLPVRTSLPPITHGISIRSCLHLGEPRSAAPRARAMPGAYACGRLVDRRAAAERCREHAHAAIVDWSAWLGRACSTTPAAGAWGSCSLDGDARCSGTTCPGASTGQGGQRASRRRIALAGRDCRRYFAGEQRRLRRRRARPRLVHAVPARGRRRAPRGPVRRDRDATASLPRSRVTPARTAPRARSAQTTASPIVLPCHRVVAAGGIGGYGSLGVEYKRRLLALEGACQIALSEDVRNELAAIAPAAPLRRARRDLGARSTPRAASTSAATASWRSISTSPSRPSPGGRSRSCGSSASRARSGRTASRRSTVDALPAPRDGSEAALGSAAGGGDRRSRRAPLARPARSVSSAGACCRAAYVRGALLGAGSVSGPRAAHLEVRFADVEGGQSSSSASQRATTSMLRVRDRGRYGVAYAAAPSAIAETLALAGASDAALAIDEHAVVGAARAHANRLTNADHANLVRTSRAAHVQLRAVRRSSNAASSRLAQPPAPARSPTSASAIRRLRFASWRRNASRGRPRRPPSGGLRAARRSWPADRLAFVHRGGEANERNGFASASTASGASGGTSSAPISSAAATSRSSPLNDIGDTQTMAHLLKYDSVLGRFDGEVEVADDAIIVAGRRSRGSTDARSGGAAVGRARRRRRVESTGLFTKRDQAQAAPRGGGEEGGHLGARDRSGRDDRARRQRRRLRPGRAHDRLQRVLHDELRRADGEGASRGLHDRAGAS